MKSTPFALHLQLATLAFAVAAYAQGADFTRYELSQLTEQWEPQPKVIDTHSGIPADAIVLFDGDNLDAWELTNPEANPWKIADGAFTVILNGVLIQYDSELFGSTEWIGQPNYKAHPAKLPLRLQDHQHFVSYRNIWIRELDGSEIQNRTILPDFKK